MNAIAEKRQSTNSTLSKRRDRPKVIVIGLDGATFKNLRPLIEKGTLPNLKFLTENGASGVLESTTPCLSPPAWTSFMTGVNPGKHGVFGFVTPFRDTSYKRELVNSRHIKAKTIFEILSEYGKASGAVNLPITYPPFKFNGFLVSCGLTTPSTDFTFTYPENLFETIKFNASDYILNVNLRNYSVYESDKPINDLIKSARQKREISMRLMRKIDWDLFVLVFVGPDRIQHFYWDCLDPEHPLYDAQKTKQVLPKILAYYQELDSILGDFIGSMDKNTSLIIMSDHGFCPVHKRVAFHRIMEQNNLLRHKRGSLRRQFIYKKSHFMRAVKKTLPFYNPFKEYIKRLYYELRKEKINEAVAKTIVERKTNPVANKYWHTIDWQRTWAYIGTSEDTVSLNVKGREPHGILNKNGDYSDARARIIAILQNLTDPQTGKKIKVKVYTKEQLYHGSCTNDAPDLVFEIENGTYTLDKGVNLSKIITKNHTRYTGKHAHDGVAFLYGNNIKKNHNVKSASILDIAPTILHLLGNKIPAYMDGKVLQHALDHDFLNLNPIEYDTLLKQERILSGKDVELTEKEEAWLAQQLADLGYL